MSRSMSCCSAAESFSPEGLSIFQVRLGVSPGLEDYRTAMLTGSANPTGHRITELSRLEKTFRTIKGQPKPQGVSGQGKCIQETALHSSLCQNKKQPLRKNLTLSCPSGVLLAILSPMAEPALHTTMVIHASLTPTSPKSNMSMNIFLEKKNTPLIPQVFQQSLLNCVS